MFGSAILISLLLGIGINLLLYALTKRNLLTLLLSLLGIPLLVPILVWAVNEALKGKTTDNLGEALGLGIGAAIAVFFGILFYTMATAGKPYAGGCCAEAQGEDEDPQWQRGPRSWLDPLLSKRDV